MVKFGYILLYCCWTIPTIQGARNTNYPGNFGGLSDRYGYSGTPNSGKWYYPVQRDSDQSSPPSGDQQMQSLSPSPSPSGGYQTSTDSYANVQQTTKKSVTEDDKYKFNFPSVLIFFKVFYIIFILLLLRVSLFRNLGILGQDISNREIAPISWGELLEESINQANQAWQNLVTADNRRTEALSPIAEMNNNLTYNWDVISVISAEQQ